MAFSRLDLNAFKIAMEKPVERACRQVALEIVEEKVAEAKEAFIENFNDNEITQEIERGEHGEGELLPSEVQGNLFSFLGFEAGSQPIEELREYLEENIYVRNKTPAFDKGKNQYIFTVNIPSKEDIKKITPMPWGTAASWVYAIETGIQGLNYYLSLERANAYDEATKRKRQREEFNSEYSRSTTGIQSKRIVSAVKGGYKAHSYLTSMINDLKTTLKQ